MRGEFEVYEINTPEKHLSFNWVPVQRGITGDDDAEELASRRTVMEASQVNDTVCPPLCNSIRKIHSLHRLVILV